MSKRTGIHTMRSTPSISVRTDLDVIAAWNPHQRAIHCANCLHCKVSQDSAGLAVRCAKGHDNGMLKPLLGVIREHNPRGFKDASKCKDFTSMGDAS